MEAPRLASSPGSGSTERMDDVHPVCVTCGVQHEALPPDGEPCAICADDRQYVGWGGQRWTTLAGLAAEGRRSVVREEVGGLWGVGVEPSVAIGQRGLLVPGEGGNLMWDCPGFLDDDGVAAIAAHGGVAAVALSHPHFYGCMIAVREAFGDVPVYVHEADAAWVRRGPVETWAGESLEVLPGRTLVNIGVHFPGGTVAHWADGADGRGAVCSGDVFQVVMDRRWMSFMYSYPNLIPEHPDVVREAVRRIEPYPFDRVYGGWWGRVVDRDAKAAVGRSADRYLRHAGHPGLDA